MKFYFELIKHFIILPFPQACQCLKQNKTHVIITLPEEFYFTYYNNKYYCRPTIAIQQVFERKFQYCTPF